MNLLRDIAFDIRPQPNNWKGEPFNIIEHKLDGHRLTIIKDSKGIVAYGRKKLDLWNKLQDQDELRKIAESCPVETVIDGELTCEGNATDVITAINDRTFIFNAFAVPWYKGVSYVSNANWEVLVLHKLGFETPKRLEYPKPTNNGFIFRQETLKRDAIRLGLEGFVLKLNHWMNWYKVKPVKTIDLIVTAMKEGTGKYEGMLGAFEGSIFVNGFNKGVCWVGGGYSDTQRAEFYDKSSMFRVMEVAYDKVETNGRLRFPRFLRWRDDKSAKECTKDQLM